MSYDSKNDRREKLPFIIRYWPVMGIMFTIGGSALAFYVGVRDVAANVVVIEKTQKTFVSKNVIELNMRIIENRIDNIEENYADSEERTDEQFIKVEKKLDQIYKFMLKQAGESPVN